MTSKDVERFWKKVGRRSEDKCWPWKPGAEIPAPSLQFTIGCSSVHPRKAAWLIRNGPVPEGTCVLHRCENARCVNPAHLFLSTMAEKMREGRRTGKVQAKPVDLAQRFWSKVLRRAEQQCWPWKATRSRLGYADFSIGRKKFLGHRVAWRLTHGDIPPGQCVCHRCDNPACCNPAHLFLATREENYKDMLAKNRMRILRGEAAGNAKLTAQQVRQIRREYIPWKFGAAQLAKKFGTTKENITKILQRKSWTHI